MIIRECQGFSTHPIVIGYPLRLVFWDVKANTYRIITPPLRVPNMCKSPVSGVLKDGMGEGVSGLDGVSHHVGKPRLLEQKMGPENGVISWLPDIYIYNYIYMYIYIHILYVYIYYICIYIIYIYIICIYIYGHDKPIYIIYLSDLKSQ